MKRCPHCASYGVYKNRRALWRRLICLPHTYGCIDCGTTFSRRAFRVATPGREARPAKASVEEVAVAGASRGWRRYLVGVPDRVTRLADTLSSHLARNARSVADLAGRGTQALQSLLQGVGLKPIPVWVVKQVDVDILHLCGIGTLEHQQRPWDALGALRGHRYRGGVRLGNTGIVLNSRLFADLIPLDALTLQGPTLARWQGRDWLVAQVPRRSWEHEGRLVVQRDGERLVSAEDVSRIHDHIAPLAAAPTTAVFQPGISRGGDTILSAYRAREQRRRDS